MFTKPVRIMVTVTALLLAALFYNVDDKPTGPVEVPDLSGMVTHMK